MIRQYAAAERRGEVTRSSNEYGLTAEDYARRLLEDARKKGWIRGFDDRPAERWYADGPEDNSTTMIFFRNEARFIERLRHAKVVRIQMPVYQEGNPTFEFEVGGFNYKWVMGIE